MATDSDLATTLAQLARELDAPRDLDTTLQNIVESAARSLPGINHVGITIAHRNGRMETRAASDPFVLQLDELQYVVGEGPCVYAIESQPVVKVEHAETEQRWPRFIPGAVKLGLKSQLGLQLYVQDETLGALNLYSTSTRTISDETTHLAELFATHAALAFGHARREDQLNSAILSRQLIGQATGVIMERYGLDEGRAFEYLARVSSHSNIKLRDIAQEVVDQANANPTRLSVAALPLV
jgi:GAF domain-containing protein